MQNEDQARNRILGTAQESFFRDGIRAVTMDELALRLRMSKRTLYQHFDSKRSLLREVMLGMTRRVDQALDESIAVRRDEFRPRLRAVLKALADALPNPSQRFFKDLQETAPDVWRELMEVRGGIIRRRFLPLFEEGRSQGALRRDLEAEVVLKLFEAMVQGVVTPANLSQLPLTAPQLLDRIVTVLMEGVLEPRARSQPTHADQRRQEKQP